MDLTGSINEATAPLSAELGSLTDSPAGSSAIDTLLQAAYIVPAFLLNLFAGAGADVGSTMGL
ncbi:hypothetical protein [Dietzia sp. PP-33]|jgi:hypothetical protein|uniref:hypothetical protein n=1 Tax=Dietzia sp. PP-33 TaxID=2957500 RepID=UPI0029A0E2C9|nr:hypothetical protein [Dietzia sp. PP-33]MDX2356881.1 hypothetical protein [Dietzia sp. PP-33]